MSRYMLRSIVAAPHHAHRMDTPLRELDLTTDELPPLGDPYERLACKILAKSKLRRYKDTVRIVEVKVSGHCWRIRWIRGCEDQMVQALTDSFRTVGLPLDGSDIACLCKDLW